MGCFHLLCVLLQLAYLSRRLQYMPGNTYLCLVSHCRVRAVKSRHCDGHSPKSLVFFLPGATWLHVILYKFLEAVYLESSLHVGWTADLYAMSVRAHGSFGLVHKYTDECNKCRTLVCFPWVTFGKRWMKPCKCSTSMFFKMLHHNGYFCSALYFLREYLCCTVQTCSWMLLMWIRRRSGTVTSFYEYAPK